jgi:hypothetical protein
VTEDKYDVQLKVEDAAIIVTSDKDPKTSCTITLTSPIMREENVAGGKTNCLEQNKFTAVNTGWIRVSGVLYEEHCMNIKFLNFFRSKPETVILLVMGCVIS